MAIKIAHARIEDAGRLALEAGKGEQKVTQQAQKLQRDLQAASDASRIQAASINASTSIRKAVMDAQNNREMQEFDSFMRAESQRRQIAWQTEKTELSQRHDFELNMQRKDLESQLTLENKMIEDRELQTKIKSLKKERDNFGISQDKYEELVRGLNLGVNMGRLLAGPGGDAGFAAAESEREKVTKLRSEAEFAKPEAVEARRVVAVKNAGEDLTKTASHRLIDPESRKEAEALSDRSDATVAGLMNANQLLQAKIDQGVQQELIKERRFARPITQGRMRIGGL